jgi:hypothetical protein
MEQLRGFWRTGAENGTSSDGSERFYMSYGPCSGGVPSAAPSPVLVALASNTGDGAADGAPPLQGS